MKRIHILGICGTFMGSLALLAREKGLTVEGSDQAVYPPMSTQLEEQGITLIEGYSAESLCPAPDCVVVGNAMKRGNPAIEYMLNEKLAFLSGPEFLAQHVLKDRYVIAVAGTHGKTTTSSMVAWILEYAGLHPGFLIGGVPRNFGVSARRGQSPYFVIEADEYDTAFFDKRSKFLHYRADIAVLNNLEFDHADIFDNVQMIQKQFHHFIRTLPSRGLIIDHAQEVLLQEAIALGCYTPRESINGPSSRWQARLIAADRFAVFDSGKNVGECQWSQLGEHNVDNALSAIVAAHHIGIPVQTALQALSQFQGVKRRMELRGEINNVCVYDDFAHHPTAIEKTLAGLRKKVGEARILAVVEFGSNTMKMGTHKTALPDALRAANQVFLLKPKQDSMTDVLPKATVRNTVDELVTAITECARPSDHVLIMSNQSFGGIYEKLLTEMAKH